MGFLGAAILVLYVNTLTAILTLGSLIGYAFVYTIYLKRATPQNIVIGGLAGAAVAARENTQRAHSAAGLAPRRARAAGRSAGGEVKALRG